jgi:hypothetical protein
MQHPKLSQTLNEEGESGRGISANAKGHKKGHFEELNG